VCDYPLARNLALMVVPIATETVIRVVLDGAKSNWSITLRDFAIRPLEDNYTPAASAYTSSASMIWSLRSKSFAMAARWIFILVSPTPMAP